MNLPSARTELETVAYTLTELLIMMHVLGLEMDELGKLRSPFMGFYFVHSSDIYVIGYIRLISCRSVVKILYLKLFIILFLSIQKYC